MAFVIDLKTNSGNVEVVEDVSAPTNCSEAPLIGPVSVQVLAFDQDSDGDGCTDWYELGENPALGGLNDPFNPNDCSIVIDPDGLYEISHELAGGYRRCMGAVEDSPLQMRVYCYTDITGIPVNPEGYPGWSGDGLLGAPPPGPHTGAQGLVYGDVNGGHTVLSGSYNAGTNEVTFTGCFASPDRADAFAYIRVVWTWDVQTGAGTSQAGLGFSSCPGGVGAAEPLQAMKLATTAQMDACYDVAGVCPYADNDPPSYDRNGDGVIDDNDAGDGVPDHRELEDDSACGRRDPFNINDYYDVSIPRDGVIDLFTDISLVIGNMNAPGGYAPGTPATVGPGTMENYDRPARITGAAGSWNRGSPDGIIDLFNDVSGVIDQSNAPVGCPGSG